MLYLIAYDIASNRRLRRVARICEDFGIRVEKSVFECNLSLVQFQELWDRLSRNVDNEEDKVIAYPIGLIAKEKISALGAVVHNEPKLTYVF